MEELHTREGSILVFMKTKHSSKRIYLKLQKDGISVNAIHGNVRQNKRLNILNKFRNQKFTVLIATDIAARGLDIPHIEHVINYDLPQRTEDYIHRIGRTARAGKKGSALSFISENDENIWKNIYKLIDTNENKTFNSEDLIGKSLNSKSKNVINRKEKKKNLKNFKRKSFRSDDEENRIKKRIVVQEILKESLLDSMMKRIELVKKRIVVQEILKESLLDPMMKRIELVKKRIVVQEILKESLLDPMMKRIELVKKRIVVQEILKESLLDSMMKRIELVKKRIVVQEVLKESLLDPMMKRIELVKKRIVVQEILKESLLDQMMRIIKLANQSLIILKIIGGSF